MIDTTLGARGREGDPIGRDQVWQVVGDRNESHAELSGSVVGRPLYAMEENNTQAESAMPGGKRIAYDTVDSDSDEDERGIN